MPPWALPLIWAFSSERSPVFHLSYRLQMYPPDCRFHGGDHLDPGQRFPLRKHYYFENFLDQCAWLLERERKRSESWPHSLSAGLDSMCMSAASPVSGGQLSEDMILYVCRKSKENCKRNDVVVLILYVWKDHSMLQILTIKINTCNFSTDINNSYSMCLWGEGWSSNDWILNREGWFDFESNLHLAFSIFRAREESEISSRCSKLHTVAVEWCAI